ncbi:uncharacterized protein [Periplaneta americana]|uniref:uncharacterized protein isoform X2 n=1 Tax=Periplaneta americana TaxID=6978 RepID=UPI0037E9B0A7
MTLQVLSHFILLWHLGLQATATPTVNAFSLMAPTYAKVSHTGSFASSTDDRGKSYVTDIAGEQTYGNRPHMDPTTETSDMYNIYYPLMEAQVVTENDTVTDAQIEMPDSLPVSSEAQVEDSGSNYDSLYNRQGFKPLMSFFRQFYGRPLDESQRRHQYSGDSKQFSSLQTSSEPYTRKVISSSNKTAYPYDDFLERSESTEDTKSRLREVEIAHQPLDPQDESTVQYENRNTTHFQNTDKQSFEDTTDSLELPTIENTRKPDEDSYDTEEAEEDSESYEESVNDNIQDSDVYSTAYKQGESINQSEIEPIQASASPRVPTKLTPPVGKMSREKNPYSYFYVGRKLWYVPLFFSVYFMLYVLALVLRSIARHKILFPVIHWNPHRKRDLNFIMNTPQVEEITYQVTKSLETSTYRYL